MKLLAPLLPLIVGPCLVEDHDSVGREVPDLLEALEDVQHALGIDRPLGYVVLQCVVVLASIDRLVVSWWLVLGPLLGNSPEALLVEDGSNVHLACVPLLYRTVVEKPLGL